MSSHSIHLVGEKEEKEEFRHLEMDRNRGGMRSPGSRPPSVIEAFLTSLNLKLTDVSQGHSETDRRHEQQ